MQIGAVLGQAWDLYKRFLKEFFLTAFIVFLVLDLLSALAASASGDGVGAGIFWGLIAFAVGVVGYFWVQAALVELVRDVRDGRADRSVMETYRAVQPHLVAVIIAGILAAIGIAIGLILLIVPGLFLLTIWSMLVPVIVIEGKSAGESFTRSREVVRGNGWNVFGLILVTFLLVGIASAVIKLLFAPLPDFLDAWLGSLVGHSLTVPFAAATLTTAYFTLTADRSVQEATPAPATETPPI
jgi:hypothetical protein